MIFVALCPVLLCIVYLLLMVDGLRAGLPYLLRFSPLDCWRYVCLVCIFILQFQNYLTKRNTMYSYRIRSVCPKTLPSWSPLPLFRVASLCSSIWKICFVCPDFNLRRKCSQAVLLWWCWTMTFWRNLRRHSKSRQRRFMNCQSSLSSISIKPTSNRSSAKVALWVWSGLSMPIG